MRLFIVQPYPSHLYPIFGLALEFLTKGERVVFTATDSTSEIVEKEGFEYHQFQYQAEYIIRNFRVFTGLFFKNITSKADYIHRYNEFKNAFHAVQELISLYNPNHVYIDQSLAEYYFFIKPYVQHITIVHTKVYSGKTKGTPPMNSSYLPKRHIFSDLLVEVLWFKELLKQRFHELILKIAFYGKDEIYFWKKHCAKYGMNWKREIDLKHCLNRGIRNVDNIILIPKELEFPTFRHPKNVSFFEKISLKNELPYFTPAYNNLKKKKFIDKNTDIVYMAFGTFAHGPKVTNFFNIVVSIIQELPETILIISKGNHPMEIMSPDNVFIFDYLPQQDVLSYTDLFITHGGLGSVKEAYYHKVPMLIAPMNKFIDQNGNAARIKINGLGDRVDIDNYSREELAAKITALMPGKGIKKSLEIMF